MEDSIGCQREPKFLNGYRAVQDAARSGEASTAGEACLQDHGCGAASLAITPHTIAIILLFMGFFLGV